MSDLISRSELIEELKSLKIVLNGKQIFSDDAKDTVLRIVNEQPTAYDIDKIVEELETERKTANNTYNSFNIDVDLGRAFGLEKAIEIVKHGDVSDDVCEWRLCDEEANVYDTSCRNPHILIEGTPKENNYEYCPYCGKKIKVVEQMDEDEFRYCHHDDTDEYHDCLEYIDMECEECPYYYADLD